MELIESFLDYLASVRGHSKNTVGAYRSDLKRFFAVISSQPEKITKADIQRFIVLEKTGGMAARTINRRLDCLSTFFDYLINEMELDLKSPIRPEYKQKVKNKVSSRTSRIHPEDAKRLMEIVRPLDRPTFMAMLLMGKQGLRIGEVRRLMIEHVDFDSNVMTIIGSKGEDREIPLSQHVKEEIKNWIEHRSKGPVVCWGTAFNAFETNGGLWKRIRYWMDKIGVVGTPHSWRRMAGTELYRMTKDIVLVQKVLGHKSIETTRQSYVDDTESNLEVSKKLDGVF